MRVDVRGTINTNVARQLSLGPRACWAPPRLLAVCAALVVGFAIWSPWLVTTAQPFPGAAPARAYFDTARAIPLALSLIYGQRSYPDPLAPQIARLAFATYLCLVVLSALGLLLVPLFWRRPHARSPRLALIAYAVWLAAATLVPLGLDAAAWVALGRLRLNSAAGADIPVVTPGPGVGLILLPAGLALGWAALVLFVRERGSLPPLEGPRFAPAFRARWHLAGASLVSAGALLWGLGFLAIPWAVVNCSSVPVTLNHFTEGACAGLDAGDALTTLVSSRIPPALWDWSGGIYALYGLLLAGGLLVVVAAWRGALITATRSWVVLWLAAASVVTALCYRGVDHIATSAPLLSSQTTGAWHGATGIPLSFFGLLLAWIGMIALDGASGRPAAALPVRPIGAAQELAAPAE